MRNFANEAELAAALALPPLEPGAFRFAKQFGPATFTCHDCGQNKPLKIDGVGTGYATDGQGNLVCYDCCGEQDQAYMRQNGKNMLYLVQDGQNWHVTNWPGTLKLPCGVRVGRHNIAGKRYDVWFRFEGTEWHGVKYGDNTQICHCRRLKAKGNGKKAA